MFGRTVSFAKAKKIALRKNKKIDRCDEYPNYYEFYVAHHPIDKVLVSKKTGKVMDSVKVNKDFYWDFKLKEYDIYPQIDIEKVTDYAYYPDLRAVTKSDGCTFFDSKNGFVFDIDGAWFMEDPIKPDIRKHITIPSDKAYEIVARDDYDFLFFGQ